MGKYVREIRERELMFIKKKWVKEKEKETIMENEKTENDKCVNAIWLFKIFLFLYCYF